MLGCFLTGGLVLVGMVIGFAAGEAGEEVAGLLLGGLVGALFGSLIKTRRSASELGRDVRILHTSLGEMGERLVALERAALGAAETAPAAPAPAATADGAAPAEPAPPDVAGEVPVELGSEPGSAPKPEPEPEPTPAAAAAPEPAAPSRASAGAPAPMVVSAAEDGPPPTADFAARIRDKVLGVNTVVWVGVLVLLVGVGLLAKYAIDHSLFPVEARLASAASIGIVLIVVGWRLRNKRLGYAVSLQGGGIGAIYVTVFFALKTYALIPAGLAFVLLVLLTIFAGILAVIQEARALAILGLVGGFLAPIIASTGQGQHVILFSYYAILNAGIVFVAWFRAWRELNILGWVFTFGIGTIWGALQYRSEHFATTEPFLILFFSFYVITPILFAWRQKRQLKGLVDGTLVFGTPLVAFGLQVPLVERFEYGLAQSSFALAFFYIVLGTFLLARAPDWSRRLVEAFLAIGVGFATMTLPFALDARWTGTGWALEGAGLVWIGVRQQRILPRLFGGLLQIAAGIALLVHGTPEPTMPVLNGHALGILIVASSGFFVAFYLNRHRERVSAFEAFTSYVYLSWAVLWWIGGGLYELDTYVPWELQLASGVGLAAVTSLACELIGRRLDWFALRVPALLSMPALFLFLAAAFDNQPHLLVDGGQIAWPVAVVAYFWVLRRHDELMPNAVLVMGHMGIVALSTLAGAWELGWGIDAAVDGARAWKVAGWLLSPLAFAYAILMLERSGWWPVRRHPVTYFGWIGAPLVVALLLAALAVNIASNADPYPLMYLPVVNPIDLTLIFALLASGLWAHRTFGIIASSVARELKLLAAWAIGSSVFVWLNGLLIRTLHHYVGIPHDFESLYASQVVQASLSIFWTVLALFMMVFATRKGMRGLWITAACLLGVVVIKLFTIDLSGLSTMAQIVSFVVVGLLITLVGYVSPVPPRKPDPPQQTATR